MAIYRPPRPRWRAAAGAGIAGVIIGGVAGWLIGASSGADPRAAMQMIRSSLTDVAGALEVVEIEYSEAVEDDDVVAETEYEGARAAAERARDLYDEVRAPLAVIASEEASEIASSLDDLIAGIDDIAHESEVGELARTTASMLERFGRP
jgi:hypothetical protein